MRITSDLRIESAEPLVSPQNLLRNFPAEDFHSETVIAGRNTIHNILSGKDKRLLAIVGPCSIHNIEAGIQYAEQLVELAKDISKYLFVVMRVYFEKPRTRLGWRGLILDPDLNGTYLIQEGLELARKLLLDITALGLPAGSEMLDPIIPQYIDDLLSWGSIGARTTESQTHREMASGLSMPVGFKNATDGSIQVAIDAIASARHKHSFIGMDGSGQCSIMRTRGNDSGHLILRGGRKGPNYFRKNVEEASALLRQCELPDKILIDCSHANSGKDYRNQHIVLRNIIDQHCDGVQEIMGFMIESNLFEGKQVLSPNLHTLKYGMSITDGCIGWDETEKILHETCDILARCT